MPRLLAQSRFLILIPIIGLALSAAFFFVFGGMGLILMIGHLVAERVCQRAGEGYTGVETTVVVEVIEHVHQFLVGTVLYITAIGFYQLFIHQVDYPDWLGWLRVDSTEELENILIGVTVVVLAINFMSLYLWTTHRTCCSTAQASLCPSLRWHCS